MVFVGPISSIFDYATFALMLYAFGTAAYSLPGTTDAAKTHGNNCSTPAGSWSRCSLRR
jgi:hypothetical protein